MVYGQEEVGVLYKWMTLSVAYWARHQTGMLYIEDGNDYWFTAVRKATRSWSLYAYLLPPGQTEHTVRTNHPQLSDSPKYNSYELARKIRLYNDCPDGKPCLPRLVEEPQKRQGPFDAAENPTGGGMDDQLLNAERLFSKHAHSSPAEKKDGCTDACKLLRESDSYKTAMERQVNHTGTAQTSCGSTTSQMHKRVIWTLAQINRHYGTSFLAVVFGEVVNTSIPTVFSFNISKLETSLYTKDA